MYGLVNKAVQQLITEKFGEQKWEEVKEQAEMQLAAFSDMEAYDDKLTYDLVTSASKVLKVPADQLLEAFGEYWTVYTAQKGYEEFFSLGGSSVLQFLNNLNHMHARVGALFPLLRPPEFKCTEQTEKSVILHYYSSRPGLTPMVIGLVKGLATKFKTPLKIEIKKSREQGHDHDVFFIQII